MGTFVRDLRNQRRGIRCDNPSTRDETVPEFEPGIASPMRNPPNTLRNERAAGWERGAPGSPQRESSEKGHEGERGYGGGKERPGFLPAHGKPPLRQGFFQSHSRKQVEE